MKDTIRLEAGRRPWEPSSDAKLIETLIYNNMPVLGFLLQGSILYIFRCIEGFGDTTHVWVYARIGSDEAEYVRKRKDRIWYAVDHVGVGSPKTVALATDEDGVLLAMDLRPEKGISLGESDTFVDFILQHGTKTAKKGSKEEEAVYKLQEMISSI
jgi:hypothetical protein